MPPAPTGPSAPYDGEADERSSRILLILGVLAAVSAVVAGAVIFSSGGSSPPEKEPVAQVRATDDSLRLGRLDAGTRVVVYEDFGNPASREFEMASRDFLRIEAARGKVLVEYRPAALLEDSFGPRALAAWGVVLRHGSARQALALRDLIFEGQRADTPDPAEFAALAGRAGVRDRDLLAAIETPDQAFVDAAREAARIDGVRQAPMVFFDGPKPLGAPSPTALADQLQRLILAKG